MCERNRTAKPSVEKPWLQYYPKELLDQLKVPDVTLSRYLLDNLTGMDETAIDFYGNRITWHTFFCHVEQAARALRAAGFRQGDQVPVLLKSSIPEFFYLLLACERIGASLLIRDNEIWENADAIRASGAHTMLASDCMSQQEMQLYLQTTGVRRVILIPSTNSCIRDDMPLYVQQALDRMYRHECAHGAETETWAEFLVKGEAYEGSVDAPADPGRPLFRCYTSGSTGPSKQVVHAARTILGALVQANLYGSSDTFRPTWLAASLPPCLVSVVISFLLLPLSSRKILLLDPFVDPEDVDLELMRLRPNCWPSIPMLVNLVAGSRRIPDDYDMSHLMSCGAGCEHMNNAQLRRFQTFLADHNCRIRFTTGYGSSESGSGVVFHLTSRPMGGGNNGVPMPLTNICICRPDTTEELGYGEQGEICVCSPAVMLGYDDPAATDRVLRVHADGKTWLHMGDVGYILEDGSVFTVSRGVSQRFGGGDLDILPMENAVADANIPGILDEFFANVPDPDHEGCYEPYLYVVLDEGYTVADIRKAVAEALAPHQVPAFIEALPQRPFWHYKTFRVGMIRRVLEHRGTAVER